MPIQMTIDEDENEEKVSLDGFNESGREWESKRLCTPFSPIMYLYLWRNLSADCALLLENSDLIEERVTFNGYQ